MDVRAELVSGTFSYIIDYLGIKSVWDGVRTVIDVAIVAYLFYKLFGILKNSRAMQLIKGVIIVLVAAMIASLFKLTTISYVINIILELIPLLLVVIFQPELRRGLESLGNKPSSIFTKNNDNKKIIGGMIEEVLNASFAMGEEHVGALIIFERETNLSEIAETGTVIDAKVTAQLIRHLFIPNTPLHDGAVIIRGDRIYSAASILPLSEDRMISKDLGTRHRAGIGISERTDCISVIVSEETGAVSVAQNGEITVNVNRNTLKKMLCDGLIKNEKIRQHELHSHKKQKEDGKR